MPEYKKIRERLIGFNPEVEPVRAKKKIVANNNRGYIAKDWEGKLDYMHPALFGRGYPPDKKIEACSAYIATGNFYRAERMTGVPKKTIYQWSKNAEWWPTVSAGIRHQLQQELDGRYTAIAHKAADELEDRIELGDIRWDSKNNKYVEVPVSAKELAQVSSIIYEKRALMRGDPTSRTERVNADQMLNDLKREFQKFAKATTIEGEVLPSDYSKNNLSKESDDDA